ncbi:MAG TPA: NAD(P)-dependent alcohol dehydrogenase [Propionibacteriaceae bacterium]|nr:NAD(P)-dependent alcohol dehydrogenase [Propionibacteriaceae bacterium]
MTTEQAATASDHSDANATMQAVVQDRYGPPDVLRCATVARPATGDNDVLIRVHAAGVHIGDWHLMTGQPYLMRVMGFGLRAPKRRIRGTDVAGTVVSVGARVSELQVGDEVFGACDGAYAEYATARPGTLARKPVNLSFEQAAAAPTSAATALTAVRDAGHVTAGQRVLVIGASGGVGLFAVQIAKAFGAEVTGVCRTSKVELVRSVGADHVIDYTQTDVGSNGQRYDVILDMGGNRPLSQLRRGLTPRGTLVLVGGEGGGRWIGGAMGRSLRALTLSPFVSQQLRMVVATVKRRDMDVLSELIEAGKLTPIIDTVHPLSGVSDAIRHLVDGRAHGKLAISV